MVLVVTGDQKGEGEDNRGLRADSTNYSQQASYLHPPPPSHSHVTLTWAGVGWDTMACVTHGSFPRVCGTDRPNGRKDGGRSGWWSAHSRDVRTSSDVSGCNHIRLGLASATHDCVRHGVRGVLGVCVFNCCVVRALSPLYSFLINISTQRKRARTRGGT